MNRDPFEHVLGVPSGKCGFTTLNYFFGNKNLASPTLSRRSKVS